MEARPSTRSPHVFIVLPERRLDALAAPELDSTLAALEAQGVLQIVINFCRASYISSSSLRVMLIHARRLRQKGGELKLCCLPEKVARVLALVGFDAVFDVLPGEELAIEAFLNPSTTVRAGKRNHAG